MDKNNKFSKILDYGILGFTVIFLASLTNSIFVNQLGYYGALLLILLKIFVSKKNSFKSVGIELPILLFILAEVISAILSPNTAQAFHNVLKRTLLLPIIYFLPVAADSIDRAKLFFKVYISFALLSAGIYFIAAFQYYLSGMMQLTNSGPSIFQYPITTAELLSFTVIFLFAFLINEKLKLTWKLLISGGFLISLSALILTYKRTGWLGLIAGIAIILILKKKYIYIGALVIIVIVSFFVSKQVSIVSVYNKDNGKKLYSFGTDGMALGIQPMSGSYYIADYDNGLLEVSNKGEKIGKTKFELPINDIFKWDDKYIAVSVDKRFFILNQEQSEIKIDGEFITKGFTKEYHLFNNKLYVLDSDSGLTIFNDPKNIADNSIYKELSGYTSFSVDTNYIALMNKTGQIDVYPQKNNKPVAHNKLSIDLNEPISRFIIYSPYLVINTKNKLHIYIFEENRISKLTEFNVGEFRSFEVWKDELYGINTENKLLKLELTEDTLKIGAEINIGFNPRAVAVSDSLLFMTNVKASRVKSIFDPYNLSNSTRISLWKAGWKIFLDNPIFGVGDIDLAKLYIRYKSQYDKEIQGHLHNNYIHILAILGLFGFIVVLFLLGKILIQNFSMYYKLKNIPFVSSYSLGAVGALVSFLVAGLTEWNFGDHEIITFIWFIVGLQYAFFFNSKGKKE